VKGRPVKTGYCPYGAAIDPAGTFIYVISYFDDDVSAYQITSSGALKPVKKSPFATGTDPEGSAIDPAGNFSTLQIGLPTMFPHTLSTRAVAR